MGKGSGNKYQTFLIDIRKKKIFCKNLTTTEQGLENKVKINILLESRITYTFITPE